MSYFHVNTARVCLHGFSSLTSGFTAYAADSCLLYTAKGLLHSKPFAAVMKQQSLTVKKEIILERVLPIFLVNGYDGVNMRLLNQAAQITTGSLYYHFKDKQDIYLQAVQKYIETPLNVFFPIPPSKSGLDEYWATKMKQLVNAHEYLRSYGITGNPCAISNYIGIETSRIYPDYQDIIKSYEQLNVRYWSIALRNTPEIKANFEKKTYRTIANIYQGIFVQLCMIYPHGVMKRPDIILK